jgi:FtsH-binding integral membrane protein
MTKQTGIIITIVVAALTLCCSIFCCAIGIYTVADQGRTLEVDYRAGIPVICLGFLVWVVPLLLWFFLVRSKENGSAVAPVEENIAE